MAKLTEDYCKSVAMTCKTTKDFWNKAILFLSEDELTFSLDNISALEKYAISRAVSSNRFTVENNIDPRYHIDVYQAVTIEAIYEEIAFVMSQGRSP